MADGSVWMTTFFVVKEGCSINREPSDVCMKIRVNPELTVVLRAIQVRQVLGNWPLGPGCFAENKNTLFAKLRSQYFSPFCASNDFSQLQIHFIKKC